MARVALTLLICLCWAADSAAQPSVRARLLASAQATRQLLKNDRTGAGYVDEGIDRNSELMPRRCPLKADVPKYSQQRPWTHDYTVRYGESLGQALATTQAARWPTPDDGPALRALLTDQDASVRSLAVEALATLHDPEDLGRIAALLDDHANGVPALGWIPWRNAWNDPYTRSEYDLVRGWYARRVSSYARVALRLMTGRDFDTASFSAWHERNQGGRSDFWYWDVRLRQRLAEADAATESARGYDERRAGAAASIRAELGNEPAEVEAKACLLSHEEVLRPCTGLRVSADRLLDLLDRRGLWDDVSWNGDSASEPKPYIRLVGAIARVSDAYFDRTHVGRLQAVLARESSAAETAFGDFRVALQVGISKLLPVASDDDLDNRDTREGYLRDAVRTEVNEYRRAQVAGELVRIDAAGSGRCSNRCSSRTSKRIPRCAIQCSLRSVNSRSLPTNEPCWPRLCWISASNPCGRAPWARWARMSLVSSPRGRSMRTRAARSSLCSTSCNPSQIPRRPGSRCKGCRRSPPRL